jgi:hypothetical protein
LEIRKVAMAKTRAAAERAQGMTSDGRMRARNQPEAGSQQSEAMAREALERVRNLRERNPMSEAARARWRRTLRLATTPKTQKEMAVVSQAVLGVRSRESS